MRPVTPKRGNAAHCFITNEFHARLRSTTFMFCDALADFYLFFSSSSSLLFSFIASSSLSIPLFSNAAFYQKQIFCTTSTRFFFLAVFNTQHYEPSLFCSRVLLHNHAFLTAFFVTTIQSIRLVLHVFLPENVEKFRNVFCPKYNLYQVLGPTALVTYCDYCNP